MATCTTVAAHGRSSRTPTPQPLSMSAIRRDSFSLNEATSQYPDWQHISVNVISPSTDSHHSLYWDDEDDDEEAHVAPSTSESSRDESLERFSLDELNTCTAPFAPVHHPGDELLYSITTEERPEEKFFDPEFQDALNATKREMRDISLSIRRHPTAHHPGTDLHALKERAQELSEFEPSRTKTIGFVGKAGVGKSSVISSLLDQPLLTCANSNGGHSIPVVTEYMFRPAHYAEPFALEVDYMSPDDIKELLRELLRTFRSCHTPTFHQDIHDIEERRHIRSRSERAWHTLSSAFRSQPSFNQQLVLGIGEADVSLVNMLCQWAGDLLLQRPGGAYCETWSSTAFTVDECAEIMDTFISNPIDDGVPAIWPFISTVRIYLSAAILQSGVILVDCPSPLDLNFASARACERCLRNCHEVFAVTTVGDALADRGLASIVAQFGRHRPLRIVCTKSEDIDARSVERQDPQITLQVRAWRQQIRALQMQTKRSEAHRRHGLLGALEEEVRIRDIQEEMEFGLKKLLVERRNCQVATRLIETYAQEAQHGDLKVFCVSNADYVAHRWEEQRRAESRLELSGIVNLRKHCHSIPAEAQFEAATNFMQHIVPAFLGSVRQWAIGGLDAISYGKAQEIHQLMASLEEIVIKKLEDPSAQLYTSRTNLDREFTSSIIVPIREYRSEWRTAALAASKEWTKWSANDYLTFCHRHGTHTTKATGARNWNEELIAPMRMQLQSNWEFFQESVEENERELTCSMSNILNELGSSLQESVGLSPAPIQTFLSTLPSRLASLTSAIHSAYTTLLDASVQLESDTLYGHSSSYINAIMAPAYHSALNPAVPMYIPLPPSPPPPPTPGPTTPSSKLPSASVTTPRSSLPPLLRPTDYGLGGTSHVARRAPSPALVHQTRTEIITTHIACTRIFPKLASMVEMAHCEVVRAAFDDLMRSIGQEIGSLVRDMRIVGGSSGGGGGGGGKTRTRGYAERVRERVNCAERVMRGVGRVIEGVRGAP